MRKVKLKDERFQRRDKSYFDFSNEILYSNDDNTVHLKLKFHPSLKVQVEDYFRYGNIKEDEDSYLLVQIDYPEDEWIYSMILSYGDKVEVIEPAHLRKTILNKSLDIARKYQWGSYGVLE